MKSYAVGSTSRSSLISLALLYILLVVLVLVFAEQILTDLSFDSVASRLLIILVGGAFPLVLLVMIVVQLGRLFRQRAAGRPGVGFKIRLLGYFFVIVLLSSVPQSILSVNFINTAMNSWFSSETGDALRGGLDIALQYYDDKVSNLNEFSESQVFRNVLQDVPENPRRVWQNIHAVNPAIDGFQVFSGQNYVEEYAAGDESAHLNPSQAKRARVGLVARDSTEASSFLRLRSDYEGPDGSTYAVLLSIALPAGFDEKAQQLTGAIETFAQFEEFQTVFLRAVIVFYIFFSLPLLLLAALVSFLLSDEIVQPIVNLEEATRRVADGDYSFRILSRSKDDLGMLVSSFNSMVTELDRSRKKILQTEKVAAWQEIAQRLAHEIKNPLTPIRLSAERMLRKYHEGPEAFERVFEPAVRSIINEVESLNTLLGEFRSFSRLPEPQKREVNLRELVDEAAGSYSGERETEIHTENIPPDLTVPVDPGQAKQVFANLFKNAMEAMDNSGAIYCRADLVKKGNSNYCRVQVQDTGPGIVPEDHSKVFNPYFTTKKHGTGLGLAIVERIVFDHKGQIWFESEQEIGTTFYLDFPLE
jgi:nitrogen fixation/metabolism regulation signal transduction histidine kinase